MKNQIKPKRSFIQYFSLFQKYLGTRMYLVLFLSMLSAATESVGIAMFIPLLQMIDGTVPNGEGWTTSLIMRLVANIQNYFGAFLGLNLATTLVLIIVGAFIFKGIFSFLSEYLCAILKGRLLGYFKSELYSGFEKMKYEYYANTGTGHFINVINEQASKAIIPFGIFMDLGGKIVTALIYMTLAFVLSWKMGLMAVAIGVFLLVIFKSLNAYVRNISSLTVNESGVISKLLIQSLQSFKYLTSTGQGHKVKEAVFISINRLADFEIKRGVSAAFTQTVREPLAVVAIMSVVLVQVSIYNEPIAPILISLLLFYRSLNTILNLQSSYQKGLESTGSLMAVSQELRGLSKNEQIQGSKLLGSAFSGIEFRHVYYTYPDSAESALDDVNIHIKLNESIAIVGSSGSGKTTLVDLITLLLSPTKGEILINGILSSEMNFDLWRGQIGYVSQDAILFDDTIANNICMWSGNSQINDVLLGEIKKAAIQAHIHSLIESLPLGYQTQIGERGIKLSGGQRQRLFIARELFRKPRLLLLDEATSALDSETEKYIQESIEALKGLITVIVIAHRLSTIKNVDNIYVLESGKITESGSYDLLVNSKNSKFSRMISAQSL
ncbi:ABC transporter ATP-binding protein [Polynucleobacter sp. UB-Siik-W21]|uniref:ABC transporter ATP-binding protein n=1 Tax=Polynucleobacter sp. UB-Siik-W21 TaxID=1855646 RepID=UPI001BFDEEFD|nr:ATP-binding cassette domain-containing protein [Polynucleobacter sp. UB-Siik-W21]QWD70699.1 ATP-binding cassette domain-containing protein [Polynucleobacter sp. UB-Siik-W21]